MEYRIFVFNWFCAVTDFVGIFTAIAWAFYTPNTGIDSFDMQDMGWFWMGRCGATTMFFAFIVVLLISMTFLGYCI